MRVNVAIADDLLSQLDKAADALSISRSAFISIAVTQKIQYDRMLQDLPTMIQIYQETTAGSKPDSKSLPADE